MSTLAAQAEEQLRATGGRMTPQRRLILHAFEELGGHPTAEEILVAARDHDSTINESTVYRTLNWLESAGLVNPCRLGIDRQEIRRERFDQAPLKSHHHFICRQCGSVLEFSSPAVERLRQDVERQRGVTVAEASVVLYGTCRECACGERSEAAEPAVKD